MDLPKGKLEDSKGAASFRRYYRSLDPILGKPKNRAYTTTILSFLVISLFLWYAIRPTVQTILSLRREIRDDLDVNSQMEAKISNLVEAQAVYQDAAQQLALLPQALPKDPDVIAVLLALRTMSQEANASISGIAVQTVPISGTDSTGSAKPSGDATAVLGTPITISLDGTYDNLKHILDSVLTMRRIVTIQSFSFTNSADIKTVASPNPPLRMILKIVANYFPEATYER